MTENIEELRQVTTVAEFMARLRLVKARSRLGYRQLELRAGRNGLQLPHSTLSAALKRDTPPRAELVEALVRVCGARDDEVAWWLKIRDRLATGELIVASPVTTGTAAPEAVASEAVASAGTPSGNRRHRLYLAMSIAALAVLMFGGGLLVGRFDLM